MARAATAVEPDWRTSRRAGTKGHRSTSGSPKSRQGLLHGSIRAHDLALKPNHKLASFDAGPGIRRREARTPTVTDPGTPQPEIHGHGAYLAIAWACNSRATLTSLVCSQRVQELVASWPGLVRNRLERWEVGHRDGLRMLPALSCRRVLVGHRSPSCCRRPRSCPEREPDQSLHITGCISCQRPHRSRRLGRCHRGWARRSGLQGHRQAGGGKHPTGEVAKPHGESGRRAEGQNKMGEIDARGRLGSHNQAAKSASRKVQTEPSAKPGLGRHGTGRRRRRGSVSRVRPRKGKAPKRRDETSEAGVSQLEKSS